MTQWWDNDEGVYQSEGQWYWLDEHDIRSSPYPTKAEAAADLVLYCHYLRTKEDLRPRMIEWWASLGVGSQRDADIGNAYVPSSSPVAYRSSNSIRITTIGVAICNGFEVRAEVWALVNQPGERTQVHLSVYNPAGEYIGNLPDAFSLFDKGIAPECIPGKEICTIGWCERESKWYGWSHRAIYGFGIGSRVQPGTDSIFDGKFPAGFIATDFADARAMATAFAESVS